MENFTAIGYQLPIIILSVVLSFFGLLTIAGGIGFIRGYEPFVLTAFSGGLAGITLFIFVITLVPFDTKYHQVYRVSGEVTSVSNVISDSGGDLTRTPVLTVEGVSQDITMDDPRAVNLKGKTVDFTCTIGWSYKAADKYSCKIYQIQK